MPRAFGGLEAEARVVRPRGPPPTTSGKWVSAARRSASEIERGAGAASLVLGEDRHRRQCQHRRTESRRARLNAMCPTTRAVVISLTRQGARGIGPRSRADASTPGLDDVSLHGLAKARSWTLDGSRRSPRLLGPYRPRWRESITRAGGGQAQSSSILGESSSRSSRSPSCCCRSRCCRPLPSRRPPWSSKVVVVGAGPGAGTSTVSAGWWPPGAGRGGGPPRACGRARVRHAAWRGRGRGRRPWARASPRPRAARRRGRRCRPRSSSRAGRCPPRP